MTYADNNKIPFVAIVGIRHLFFYFGQFGIDFRIDAVATYQQVVEHNTTGVDYALFQQGYAQGLLHRYPNKIQTMQTLETRFPHSDYADDALYEQARAHLQLDQYNEAIKAYTQLTTTSPTATKSFFRFNTSDR